VGGNDQSSDRLTILVIVGIMTEAYSFRSQVGIGSESDCLFPNKILETSDSEVGLKTEKSGGATGGKGECGKVEEELLASERRSLDILSVKKEAKRSAIEMAANEEGKVEADLRFKSLFTVCQRHRGSEVGESKSQFDLNRDFQNYEIRFERNEIRFGRLRLGFDSRFARFDLGCKRFGSKSRG